jgi:galactose mutarotase-like enzyme
MSSIIPNDIINDILLKFQYAKCQNKHYITYEINKFEFNFNQLEKWANKLKLKVSYMINETQCGNFQRYMKEKNKLSPVDKLVHPYFNKVIIYIREL